MRSMRRPARGVGIQYGERGGRERCKVEGGMVKGGGVSEIAETEIRGSSRRERQGQEEMTDGECESL